VILVEPQAQDKMGLRALPRPGDLAYPVGKTGEPKSSALRKVKQMSAHVTSIQHAHTLNRDSQSRVALYQRALDRGRRGQTWSMLGGRLRCMLSLESVRAASHVVSSHDTGLRTVPIDRIMGSEGRAHDFDCDFNPLHDMTRDRWLGIASAMQKGRALPPVALIQVGDRYFVRDGHHRISVARALGRQAIEATVEVWLVEGTLPWKQRAQAPGRNRARNQEHSCTPPNGSRLAPVLRLLSGMLRPVGREAASQVGG
jgi:hypothetical protein